MIKLKMKLMLLTLIFCGASSISHAQEIENTNQYRIGLSMDWKMFDVKGLKFSLEPELRYGDGFSYERFQLESGIQYKTLGFLYFGASYRFIFEPSEEMTSALGVDSHSRYSFHVGAKESFGRFTPSLRVLYTNYNDEDYNDNRYLRYRAKVDYDIDNCKFTPNVYVEWFQDTNEGLLARVRYGAGVDYKVKKDRYLGLGYKLDYYTLKYKNRHIISLGYKVSF